MEFVYAITGIMALGVFAAVLGFDARQFIHKTSRSMMPGVDGEDPASTMGVTRSVVTELLDKQSSPSSTSSRNSSISLSK